jgi:DNA repair exonuclease SbcCD nuclease subunit
MEVSPVRLLHLADVHLERPFSRASSPAAARRRALLRATLDRAVTLAADRRVDALCIAGDLYERENSTVQVGEYLAALFGRLAPIPVLIAPGNHDYYAPGCLYDRVPWASNVHVFRSAEPSEVAIADGVVVGAAFTTAEDGRWLRPPDVAHDKPRVGLFHADLVAGNSGSSPYRPLNRADVASAGLAFALLGHQHTGMIDPAGRVAYTGSLEPLDHTEQGSRWAHLLDVSSGGVRSEAIPIAASTVRQHDVSVAGIVTAGELARCVSAAIAGSSDDYVVLTLTGERTGELALDWQQALTPVAGLVTAVTDRTSAIGDWRLFLAEKSVRGRFVRDVAAELDRCEDDPARTGPLLDELAVGLAALDGRMALPI